MIKKGVLILLRHGQSEWNKRNLFTGWVDIPLSREGIEEALDAGRAIADIPIDYIFTSNLIRGIMTAFLAMSLHKGGKIPQLIGPADPYNCCNSETAKTLIPTVAAWQLNERMYGDLQGMNKEAMKRLYGEAQVQLWRRSFDCAPPGGESLKATAERTLPYFKEKIAPLLTEGKNVLVAAHGNSLRSIVMYLDKLSEEEVVSLEIPTGKPLFYD